MGRKAPPGGKVERRVIAGIPVRFVYYPRSRSIEAEPDEDALSRASVESVLRFWATVGEWADKVRAGGSGWTACGVPPDDGGDPLAFSYDPNAKGWFDGKGEAWEDDPAEEGGGSGPGRGGPAAGSGTGTGPDGSAAVEVPKPDHGVGDGPGEANPG